MSYVAPIDHTSEAFGVAIPDCPGCCAMGDTFDDAIAKMADALNE